MIPEHVPVVTSVGPGRPELLRTPLGGFQFNHLAANLLFGYSQVEVGEGQSAFVASPEKALLDLVYLTPGGDSAEYLGELRLQHFGGVNPEAMAGLAAQTGRAKLIRAAGVLRRSMSEGEGEPL
jgi:hypothetical protein